MTVLVTYAGIIDGRQQLSTSRLEFFDDFPTFQITVNNSYLSHAPSVFKWKFECCQQCLCFRICLCSRGNRDVHPPQGIDFVIFDLRENDLLLYTHIIIAASIEGSTGNTAKVTN